MAALSRLLRQLRTPGRVIVASLLGG